ncbi:hypothetical protein [Kitasatospora sp. MAP12-9]|uniref:hypothetical protein n=1 Tax=Kitasatospora sp. MAP12-9 TaxID=3035100 RepID=UPI003D2038C3
MLLAVVISPTAWLWFPWVPKWPRPSRAWPQNHRPRRTALHRRPVLLDDHRTVTASGGGSTVTRAFTYVSGPGI